MQVVAKEPGWKSRKSPPGALDVGFASGMVGFLPLTAIKSERFKYCLRRKAKYLSMCLQVPSVCWAFINAGAIWVPDTCAPSVSFWLQAGFPAGSAAEGLPARQEGG